MFWALWAPWCAASIVVASVFQDSLSFGYTLAGVAGACGRADRRVCELAGTVTHLRARLDDVIHQPVRFSIAAALAAADSSNSASSATSWT